MRPKSQFKIKFAMKLTDNEQPDDEWSFQSSDERCLVFMFKHRNIHLAEKEEKKILDSKTFQN